MRNNEERLGSKKSKSASTPTAGALAPLDFVRPTTVLELPSKGTLYPEHHPLHGQETIEIRQMTTAEEDILSNTTLLRNGTAIDKFLERILIDSKLGPKDLLIGDKNAVLIQSRIDGYGPEYKTQITCPACTSKQNTSFDLTQCYQTTETTIPEYVTVNDTGTFSLTLDNGWEVEFRAMNGEDEIKLSKLAANKKKASLSATPVQDQLNTLIVSISGHTDKSTISQAVQHMTGKQSRLIRETYKKVIPNVELKSEFACGSCGATTEVEVPLTADFFWART